jgi:hypothetical protein
MQVEELRNAGASELQRRRSLEATLKQAASLFRKELANKSDEVSVLQVGGDGRGERRLLGMAMSAWRLDFSFLPVCQCSLQISVCDLHFLQQAAWLLPEGAGQEV